MRVHVPEEIMTAREVAALSKRSVGTLRNRARQGLDPQPIRRGTPGELLLYRRVDVLRWLGLRLDDPPPPTSKPRASKGRGARA